MKEIPRPPCKNRSRTTLRCRRMCCKKPGNPDNQGQTVQYQLGLLGSGDYCRLGCCNFAEKHAKHSCRKAERL